MQVYATRPSSDLSSAVDIVVISVLATIQNTTNNYNSMMSKTAVQKTDARPSLRGLRRRRLGGGLEPPQAQAYLRPCIFALIFFVDFQSPATCGHDQYTCKNHAGSVG